MKCNVGRTDRILRVVIGLAIVGLGIYFGSWWGAIGLVPLATAAIGWCPLYLPLRVSTCGVEGNSVSSSS